MKIVAIGDTHGKHERLDVPPGDVLVHAGDFSKGIPGYDAINNFNKWLGRRPFKERIVIAGNHDIPFEVEPKKVESLLSNATYLRDNSVVVDGVKFYGSPWTPEFNNWAFNLERGEELREKWEKIPVDTDVLITHGPPQGICDKVRRNSADDPHQGCEELRDVLLSKLDVKVHIFGHIHEAYGYGELNGTRCYNVSSVDFNYQPVNQPVVIDLQE